MNPTKEDLRWMVAVADMPHLVTELLLDECEYTNPRSMRQ